MPAGAAPARGRGRRFLPGGCLAAGRAPQDRGALQRQPSAAAAQPQAEPQWHDASATDAVDDAALALQPQAQAAPGQSTQVHERVAGTFMAISWC